MKKRAVIFCNKYLGFTLLTAGGVLEDLTDAFEVTIITSSLASKSIKAVTEESATVLTYELSAGKIRTSVYNTLSNILNMTYAKSGERRNLTGILHRRAHLQLVRNKNLAQRLQKQMVVWLSIGAEHSKIMRKALQILFYIVAPKSGLTAILSSINPTLCIATTAGLEEDGIFFAVSRSLKIPCLALIQSWDRTASKGYPCAHPDHCIVWNKSMAHEAISFLEIPNERVYVEGAPLWDQYLSENSPLIGQEKVQFFKQWDLDTEKKLVFVAINGLATHDENLQMIRDIAQAVQRDELPGMQFMFRSHPGYLVAPSKTKEIEDVFNACSHPDLYLMHPIVVDPRNKDYIITQEDRKFMHNMFRACDVTVSMMSTWMIESSIFNKPNICIEYGRYITQLYDFDLREYKAEHIARIFSYDAIDRVHSTEELILSIKAVLTNPNKRKEQRQRLAEAESGPHKGHARKYFISRILKIAG